MTGKLLQWEEILFGGEIVALIAFLIVSLLINEMEVLRIEHWLTTATETGGAIKGPDLMEIKLLLAWRGELSYVLP